MNVAMKLSAALCLLGLSLSVTGCGSSSAGTAASPVGASGRLTQGPVVGATIYADNVSGGVRFTKDSAEVGTTTDANGNFTLPSVPDYNYILVSVGGVDKLTGSAALRMIAPAGSANVTPLTTLVALDTTGLVKAKIEALGAKFDADISSDATPALLNLSKSVETVVAALSATITSGSGATSISAAQLATVQVQAMQSIAASLSTTAQDLSKPASLTTAMTTAVVAAVNNINTHNSNITLPSAQAATIAGNAVAAATTAVLGASAVGSSTSASTTTTLVESSVITLLTSAGLTAAVTSTATTVSATTTVAATPTSYQPPVIPVSTVVTNSATGSTGGTQAF